MKFAIWAKSGPETKAVCKPKPPDKIEKNVDETALGFIKI